MDADSEGSLVAEDVEAFLAAATQEELDLVREAIHELGYTADLCASTVQGQSATWSSEENRQEHFSHGFTVPTHATRTFEFLRNFSQYGRCAGVGPVRKLHERQDSGYPPSPSLAQAGSCFRMHTYLTGREASGLRFLGRRVGLDIRSAARRPAPAHLLPLRERPALSLRRRRLAEWGDWHPGLVFCGSGGPLVCSALGAEGQTGRARDRVGAVQAGRGAVRVAVQVQGSGRWCVSGRGRAASAWGPSAAC
mmetsp:Transcript_37792/g.89412  ORF Transcript_37792/g.89412 Transcript_37792/m.89412 type:complete len:251 (-) Transcript_37792:575-1327(-)